MKRKMYIPFACAVLCVCALSTSMLGQSKSTPHPKLTLRNHEPITHGTDPAARSQAIVSGSAANLLPVWSFQVASTRDGGVYAGSIVGANPTLRGDAASVNVVAQLIPVILKLHTIGTAIDPKTGLIKTKHGNTTLDPTVADTACLSAPNNVPADLVRQSPILSSADFNFGGTDVGTTQYTDAFQRASFWNLIDRKNYHVHLTPRVLTPLVLDVPAANGLALAPNVLGTCSPEGIVDIGFIDAAVVAATQQIPGVSPKTFPGFLLLNTGMSFGDPTNLGNCCAGGYHGINPTGPVTFQTYSPFLFQTNGAFREADDTVVMSHEVAEWMNDPYIVNPTPAWGHIGQVLGCQGNLEVGDPLSGTNTSPIVGKNGFTYHLQELAFFSWFYGAPSVGIHGWFSDNGTFMTDAGPPCM